MLRVPLGATLRLTQNDLKLCMTIAKSRTERNRSAGVIDRKYSQRSSFDVEVIGVIGEFSFLTMTGMPLDRLLDTSLCSHYHDRGDMIYNGKKIDIKCTTGLHNHNILVKQCNAYNLPGYYVFMVLDRPAERTKLIGEQKARGEATFTDSEEITAHFRGICRAEEVIGAGNLRQLSFGTFYQYPSYKMHSFGDIDMQKGDLIDIRDIMV